MDTAEFRWTPQSGEYVASSKNSPDRERWAVYKENWPTFPVIFGLVCLPAVARGGAPTWYPLLALFITVVCFFSIVSPGGYEVYAGEGWLKDGPTTVHTDRLKKLKLTYTAGGARLELRDHDGNYIYTSSKDLVRDPQIWALLSAGVHKSYADGLRVDTLTAIAFVLPRPRSIYSFIAKRRRRTPS